MICTKVFLRLVISHSEDEDESESEEEEGEDDEGEEKAEEDEREDEDESNEEDAPWEPRLGLVLMDSGFTHWPARWAGSHVARMDNLHAAFRQFCVDGANTARMFPERAREKIIRNDFVLALLGGPGRVLSVRPVDFAESLARAKMGALTVEAFQDSVASCGPRHRSPQGFRGWDTGSVEHDIIEKMRRSSPRGRTGVLLLDPEGREGRDGAAPHVDMLWIIAGDDMIDSAHGSAGAGNGFFRQRLREVAQDEGWTVAALRLPGRRVYHSAPAIGQVLAYIDGQRVGGLFL